MKAGIVVLIALFLTGIMFPAIATASAAVPESAASSGPYPSIFSATVAYKSTLMTQQATEVYVNATYGFDNYNLTVYFAGENLTGFLPSNTYHQYSASNPYFTFNITAPATPQTMMFVVEMSATNANGNVTYTSTDSVHIVAPLKMFATITNSGPVPLNNVTLTFLIDGAVRSTVVVPTIASGKTVRVNTSIVVVPALSSGKHTLTVRVSGNNPLVLINGVQATSYSSSFYYGTPPNYNWIFYIAAAVVAFMAFLVFASGRRLPAGAQRPKWRK